MRVILNVLSGAEAGRKILLDANQLLRVGRTSWANVALPDSQMSRVHFELRTDSVACYVRDAESRNGTLVNGQAVMEAVLHDNDEIVAGETRFRVHIEGDQPEKAAPVSAVLSKQAPRARAPADASFVVAPTPSGLRRFCGRIDQIAPVQLASLLITKTPLMLIVDFHRIEMSSPFGDQASYLYDWLDPVVQQHMSPVLVDAAGCEVWPSFVEMGWGCNAVVCCYTPKPFAEFAAMARGIGRAGSTTANETKPGVTDSIVGIGWPTVLAAILNSHATRILDPWSAVAEFVLLEDPDDSESWILFGPPALGHVLEELGLTDATAEGGVD